MPTIEQIKAARALLGWSQADLAAAAGLSQTGIARIENGENKPNLATSEKIQIALEIAAIEFIDDRGVAKRKGEITALKGEMGMREFYDDAYNQLKTYGGELLISNVDQSIWEKWAGPQKITEHRARMKALNNFKMRVLLKNGDTSFTVSDYAKGRWISEDLFDSISFVVYPEKLAFVLFDKKDLVIYVIKDRLLHDAYKRQFEVLWKSASNVSG